MKKFDEKKIRELKSSKSDIFMWWKWGDVYDYMKKHIEREDYWKYVGEIAIIEMENIIQSNHLLEDDIRERSGIFYIVCESSRGSKLYEKYIPQKVLPLFKDILDKANAKGVYRKYEKVRYI